MKQFLKEFFESLIAFWGTTPLIIIFTILAITPFALICWVIYKLFK